MIERPASATPRAAATLVLLRQRPGGPEVLLTRRPASMRFGANLFVFPGGSLDPGEDAATAAARETLEETGIAVDPGALVPLSRWVTPPSLPIRYDTRFLGAVVDGGTDVVRPSAEVVEWRWLRPIEALEAMATARLAMWQPTIVTLQQLEGVSDDASLRAEFGAGRSGLPPIGADDAAPQGRTFRHAWAGGIEGRAGTTIALGDREWVIVDPGDPTGETSDRIVHAAEDVGARLAGVVITSLEPELHAGVEMLATGLGLPVAGPEGASGRVPYAVTELVDGEAIPFGDAPLSVRVDAGPAAANPATADRAPARWSERAARLRVVAGPPTSA